MRRKGRKQGFFEGALFLTLGVLTVKIIGALYKVPLSAVIGEEGMGYFSTAYSFYNVLFALSTAGLPVAVSRAVSAADARSDRDTVRKIHRTAVPLFIFAGVFGFAVVLLFSPLFTRAVRNPGALPALLCLSPSVLLCSMASAYKGYFEGRRNMVPTAVSQVIEAFVKLTVGLFGAVCVMRAARWSFPGDRTPYGAAAAISGVTAGSLFSLLFLVFCFRREAHGQKPPVVKKEEKRALSKQLLRFALPVSVNAVAVSISGLIDASLLQTRLFYVLKTNPVPLFTKYRGCIPEDILENTAQVPNYLFGCYNMALTLFMLIPSITQAFSVSALPNVTAAAAGGNGEKLKKTASDVLRLTAVFALPAGLGLFALAGPIAKLVYGERLSTPIIADVLCVLGPAAVFSASTTPLSSILQAVGKVGLSVKITLSGLLLKVILNYILAGLPDVHFFGGALSTLISTSLTALFLYIALCRTLKSRMPFWRTVGAPLFSAVLCVLAARSVLRTLHFLGYAGRLSALPGVLIAALFYAASLVLTGAVTAQDLSEIKARKNLKKYRKNIEKT